MRDGWVYFERIKVKVFWVKSHEILSIYCRIRCYSWTGRFVCRLLLILFRALIRMLWFQWMNYWYLFIDFFLKSFKINLLAPIALLSRHFLILLLPRGLIYFLLGIQLSYRPRLFIILQQSAVTWFFTLRWKTFFAVVIIFGKECAFRGCSFLG